MRDLVSLPGSEKARIRFTRLGGGSSFDGPRGATRFRFPGLRVGVPEGIPACLPENISVKIATLPWPGNHLRY